MLIVYTNVCTPCKYRYEMQFIRDLARIRGVQVQINEVRFRPDLQQEAASITNTPLPFVYNDETKAVSSLMAVRSSDI